MPAPRPSRKIASRKIPAPPEDLCLEFADTRYWRGSDPATETLSRFDDLVAWCRTTQVIDKGVARDFDAWRKQHETEAAALFEEALSLREAIYRIFHSVASGQACAHSDIRLLNLSLAAAPKREFLTGSKCEYAWELPPGDPIVANLLAPVLWSAADLLVGPRRSKVRACANEKCQWLFVDDSKSGTRRWCSMNSCGNRAKAHRHYMRKTGRTEGQ